MLSRRSCTLAAVSVCSWALLATCAGTEAGNPVVEPAEVTPCKSGNSYMAAAHGNIPAPHADVAAAPRRAFSSLNQALSSGERLPVWLECVQWELEQDALSLHVSNFRGGCAIAWEGTTYASDTGEIRMDLENTNPECAVASCGNCIYDAQGQVKLRPEQAQGDLAFSLRRLPCNDANGLETDWTLPLQSHSAGIVCGPADLWGAAAAHAAGAGRDDELYTPCVEPGGTPDSNRLGEVEACGAGLSCVEGRCLPACTEDSECPLDGALVCRAGFCRLPD